MARKTSETPTMISPTLNTRPAWERGWVSWYPMVVKVVITM